MASYRLRRSHSEGAAPNWYSVQAPPGRIREHIDGRFRGTVTEAMERNARTLSNLAHHHDFVRFRPGLNGGDSALYVASGPTLTLPGSDFLNDGWLLFRKFPQCLVHGDMHGGNVMIETGPPDRWPDGVPGAPRELRRVCLIDYRSAGPGPRCLDAVAVESSIRIANSEELLGIAEDSPSETLDLQGAMTAAVRQYDNEKKLYLALFRPDPKNPPKAEWCQMAGTVITTMQKAFAKEEVASEQVTSEEYVQTALLYVARQLHYDMHAIDRIRLCTWLAALYSLAKDLSSPRATP